MTANCRGRARVRVPDDPQLSDQFWGGPQRVPPRGSAPGLSLTVTVTRKATMPYGKVRAHVVFEPTFPRWTGRRVRTGPSIALLTVISDKVAVVAPPAVAAVVSPRRRENVPRATD